jgi:hypothetical protein
VNITMLMVTGTASLINVLKIGPAVRSMRKSFFMFYILAQRRQARKVEQNI